MSAKIKRINQVLPHPESENLTLNWIDNTIVVSNKENGENRYRAGQLVVYVSEGSIVPDYLLRMGYYDEEKGKGLLAGSKGNRVKNRKFAGIVSEGLIFPIVGLSDDGYPILDCERYGGHVFESEDVSNLLDVTEWESK